MMAANTSVPATFETMYDENMNVKTRQKYAPPEAIS